MPPNEPPSVSVTRGHRRSGDDPLRSVVWVRGEHDIATRVHLSVSIAQAARLDDADIVVDLSGVTFMDASTVGALVVARNRLRGRSRSLSVRAPSPRARKLLDLCGLARLIDERPGLARPLGAPALGSWVDVPAWDRTPEVADSPAPDAAPVREPANATVQPRAEHAGAVQQRRAPP